MRDTWARLEHDGTCPDGGGEPPLAIFGEALLLDLFERFLFLGDDRNIQRVYVGGRVVVARDGSSTANGE